MADLAIKTLGLLRFVDEAGRERRAATRKTAVLAAFLAVQPDRRFSREAVAGLLWGDKDETRARHSLSQAISDVRRAFSARLIRVDADYVWSPSGMAEVDVHLLAGMEAAQASLSQLEAVEGMYEGDFLSGFDLGQEAFDGWLLAERERLRQRVHAALHELLAIRLRGGNHEASLRTARKILDIDPYDEAAHRSVMRCYAAQGFPRRAVEHFKALEAELRRELDVEPEAETIALDRRIASGRIAEGAGRTLSEFAFVLEQLPYSVAVTDTENRIVGWNRVAEDTLGFTKAEMIGRTPTSIYASNGDASLAESILRKAVNGGRWVGDVLLTTKAGATLTQRRIVTPLYGPQGAMVGAFGHGFCV